MYVYCISTAGELYMNAIKVNCCNDMKELDQVFDDCKEFYGNLYNKYIIKLDQEINKKKLYEMLKINDLKKEGDFFKLDNEYDFSYYVKRIDDLKK